MVDTRQSRIFTSGNATTLYVTVPAEDDGPGIAEDDRTDVFTAGYSTGDDGTDLGLSIVKQVVDAHDWEIRVTDGSEGGARFQITGVEFTAE
jgi:signal transduction histidine kinase